MAKPSSGRDDTGAESWRFLPLNSFVDSHMRDLPRVPALVFVALWRDAKLMTGAKGMTRRGYFATTSRKYLADRIGCSESAVTKAVKRLKAAGLVKLIRAGRPGVIAQYQVRYAKPNGG